MKQLAGLGQIVGVGRRGRHVVNQSLVRIHSGMGLHAEVPLVTRLCLVHLGIDFPVLILGGTGRCNQGGVNHCALLEQQALGRQRVVDRACICTLRRWASSRW